MISIIVAVYNIEAVVHHCIDSIISQTSCDWELILVDDGSTDGSGIICQQYAGIDNRIKYISKVNGGLSSARNEGLKYSAGQWIMFVDGDDFLLPDALENLELLLSATKGDIDFIQYGYIEATDYNIDGVIRTNSPETFEKLENPAEKFQYLYKTGGEAASMCTKLLNQHIFDQLRFKEGIIHEDEQFTTHLLLRDKRALYVDYKPYIYVKRFGSIITQKFSKKKLDIIQVLKERIELLEVNDLINEVKLFRLRFINTLINLYMSAYFSQEYESMRIVEDEFEQQIKSIQYKDINLRSLLGIRIMLEKFGLPVLKMESMTRKTLNKHIAYD